MYPDSFDTALSLEPIVNTGLVVGCLLCCRFSSKSNIRPFPIHVLLEVYCILNLALDLWSLNFGVSSCFEHIPRPLGSLDGRDQREEQRCFWLGSQRDSILQIRRYCLRREIPPFSFISKKSEFEFHVFLFFIFKSNPYTVTFALQNHMFFIRKRGFSLDHLSRCLKEVGLKDDGQKKH